MLNHWVDVRRIEGAEVSVTQGVSQTSGTILVSLEDDMMQTKRMTIEDLIESSDVCHLCIVVMFPLS